MEKSINNIIKGIVKNEIAIFVSNRRLCDLETDFNNRLCKIEQNMLKYQNGIKEKRSFANACKSWHSFEQDKLENEVSQAIYDIAIKHERSNRAISIRIKELFENGFEYK